MNPPLTNLAMWSLIIGTVMPPLIAIIQQPKWSGLVRSSVMVISCILAGGVTAYLENGENFNGKNILQAILVTAVAAIAAYHGFWKPSGIAGGIEQSTSAPRTAP